jgi:hypothetical protein
MSNLLFLRLILRFVLNLPKLIVRRFVSPSEFNVMGKIGCVLIFLAMILWAIGCHGATLPIGDAVSDQQVSPIGNLADMGSLFAAVLVIGAVAVGNALDRKGEK